MGGPKKIVAKLTKTRKRTSAGRDARANRSSAHDGASATSGTRGRGGDASPATVAPDKSPAATAASSPRSDRAKRLLDLVMLLLRARTPVTFRDIREQFDSYQTRNVEAGLRAFERDKADLLELGVPVRYVTPDEDDSLEEGGYVVDLKRFRLPEVHLTPEEISALVLATSVAHAVPGESHHRVVNLALKKLAFDVPEAPDTPLEWPPPPSALTRREPVLVHFPAAQSRTTRQLGDRFAELETATRNRKRVSFRYRSASNGYVRTREVDPYGLFYREGSWLLVGYCHLRKDVRSFRLDRMSDVVVAPKPKTADFERPGEFDVRAYANRSPWTFRSAAAEEVELQIRPDAAARGQRGLRRRLHPHRPRRRLGDRALPVRQPGLRGFAHPGGQGRHPGHHRPAPSPAPARRAGRCGRALRLSDSSVLRARARVRGQGQGQGDPAR